MWFIRLCIERPILIIMIEALLLILGFLGFRKIGIDLYPKIDPPVVTVTTEYPGSGPDEIETLVSKVIEEDVNQIGGIKRIQSTSQQNISRVVVEFELEVDARFALNEVRDKVARAKTKLPTNIEEPIIERVDFEDRPIVRIAVAARDELSGESLHSAVIRSIADEQVKPLLQKVTGVGQVDLFGGLEREVQVQVQRQKLQSYNLSMTTLRDALLSANLNVPAGEIWEEPSRRALRVMGEFVEVSEIQEVIVTTLSSGQVVRVADIAQVVDTHKEPRSYATINGRPTVVLEVKKQSDANTVKVAEALLAQVGHMASILPVYIELEVIYDGAHYIKSSVYDVIETIVIAGVLAVLVVYLFLGSVQSTLITGFALPSTIITSFFALELAGFTLNIMTLLGMTLSVGLILDDAIVIRENIWKKIESGLGAHEAAFVGTREVFVAVLATSLTVLAVFFPVTFIPGVVGRFFAAFALTVCISVILSTFDALTMAPMLSANLMRPQTLKARQTERYSFLRLLNQMGQGISSIYEHVLSKCLARPWLIIVVSFALLVGAFMLLPKIGFTFLPESESGEFDINLEAQPGTSFLRMVDISAQAERLIADAVPEKILVSSRVGNEVGETHFATTYLKVVPYRQRQRTSTQIKNDLRVLLRPLVEHYGLILGVATAGGARGGAKPVSVVIQGPDIHKLQQISQDLVSAIEAKVEGVANVETNLKPGRQELQLSIDRTNAAAFGIKVQEIGDNVRGLYEGLEAGVFRDRGEEHDIRILLPTADRMDTFALDEFSLPSDRGLAVPLTSLVQKELRSSPTSIIRIDQRRSARIEADLLAGAALANVVEAISEVAQPLLIPGYTVSFQGQAESLKDLQTGALFAMLLGAAFIYMVMASLYESLVIPFAILMTLPLALIGAIAALFFAGKLLDIYGIIGVILLMALVTKNAILLVDYVEQLRGQGMERMEALVQGSKRRMRPIMMTTIAMVAGMIPVAMGYGEINKVRAGMGVTAIGGLLSSTLLSLLVIPCFYIYLDNLRNLALGLIRRYYFGIKEH